MNFLLIILVYGVVAVTANNSGLKCDLEDLKRCEDLKPFYRELYPTEPEKLKTHCSITKPYVECYAEVFDKCPKQTLFKKSRDNFFGSYNLFKKVCGKDENFRNEYLQNSKCLSKIFTTTMTACFEDTAKKEKFGTCEYYRAVEACGHAKAEQICRSDSLHVFTEIFNSLKVPLQNGACDI